ncbi:putative RNA methyltransferase At5g10620 isoform X2 [Rhodamnia argentea]|uniref:RNA methyltransferase At5g10620 isoform X2 n=1 Tax=Rhodamnia argentea TaxID=178133 RepID=A0A8B8QBN1_9MYRT|nr:putative RNA methyltransferase At5g10620 isoform X2 [Rhodamnia argentea]
MWKWLSPFPSVSSQRTPFLPQVELEDVNTPRALPIRVFTVGKKRSPAVQLLVDEYTSKLRHYCAIEDVQVRCNPRNAREKQAQIVDEDMAVMNLIRPDDWVVLLDEQGIDIESEEMAELIGGAADKGASKLSFCIGGPYGHGPKSRERANISIKLSSLVLNHQIALVVLMEQLYRLFARTTIAKSCFHMLLDLRTNLLY